MMTADGSIILLEFTLEGVEPKVKISRPQINQVSFTVCGFLACIGQHNIVYVEFRLTENPGLDNSKLVRIHFKTNPCQKLFQ